MMMTAHYPVEDLVTEALKEGAYGIIYKPIELGKVAEFVEHVEKSDLALIFTRICAIEGILAGKYKTGV
jgi:DNA-binding NtrC family response regulator